MTDNNEIKLTRSAVQSLQESIENDIVDIPLDDTPGGLDNIEDITKIAEQKRVDVLNDLAKRISNTLKTLKERGREGLEEYVFNEKIALLERTKTAVDQCLLQILTSPSSSPRSYEALSLIIKVNSDLLKDLIVVNDPQEQDDMMSDSSGPVIVASSEVILDSLLKDRHERYKKKKNQE